MTFDLRHYLTHSGDIFVDVVQKTADSAIMCSKSVFLIYDIKSLQCKKRKISRNIGERVAFAIKEGTIDVSKDATLAELIASLNSIEKDLAAYENERNNLINPFKAK